MILIYPCSFCFVMHPVHFCFCFSDSGLEGKWRNSQQSNGNRPLRFLVALLAFVILILASLLVITVLRVVKVNGFDKGLYI